MLESMDEDIKKIARMITELDGLAYSTHKPIVEDICTRRASESEVEQILDYMVRMCNRDRKGLLPCIYCTDLIIAIVSFHAEQVMEQLIITG